MTTLRYLKQHDAAMLSRLAATLMRSNEADACVAGQLADLIASSILLPENDGRTSHVSLYSRVTCCVEGTGDNDSHSMMIVCPQDANYSLARLSVLTPMAMALLGRACGSVVEVNEAPGQVRQVHLVNIQPACANSMYPDRSIAMPLQAA